MAVNGITLIQRDLWNQTATATDAGSQRAEHWIQGTAMAPGSRIVKAGGTRITDGIRRINGSGSMAAAIFSMPAVTWNPTATVTAAGSPRAEHGIRHIATEPGSRTVKVGGIRTTAGILRISGSRSMVQNTGLMPTDTGILQVRQSLW